MYPNFSSQPHKEADSSRSSRSHQSRHFNSQPHEEADFDLFFIFRNNHISTRSLTRRLTAVPCAPESDIVFQLAASRGGWLHLALRLERVRYFNSQPHEEADITEYDVTLVGIISTRSLTRRLTYHRKRWIIISIISTRSLTRRLTSNSTPVSSTLHISTRSLTRRLTTRDSYAKYWINISTRSLTRRLTVFFKRITIILSISTRSLTRRLTLVLCVQ